MPLRCAFFVVLFLAGGAQAATIESLKVSRQDRRYEVNLDALLDAPAAAAYAAFADPGNLPSINPAVRHVEVLGRDGEAVRLATEVRVCAALYCRNLRQVNDMHYAPRPDGGDMSAEVLPLQGDFKSGAANWQFRSVEAKTHLHFHAELEPAFWIPPVIGPWLVQRSLRIEAETTSAGIERLAQGRTP
jgi:hypothetical protein